MDDAEFDYVIVGAGSAGCVLANRLSADPGVTVCLVEAGPEDRHPYLHIPIGTSGLMHHKVLNWRFDAAPQPEIGNRSIYTPRGRVLGGTSAVNGMVYIRGHPSDYDDWAAAGNKGWSFAEVLPYFKRSENNLDLGSSPLHGTGGELTVMSHRHPSRMSHVLVQSAQSLGFAYNPDFNDGDRQEGFGIRQVTQRRGLRQSTATAFLAPVRSRPNLTVMTGCTADRLVLDGAKAVGAEVRAGGGKRRLGARREVIVAAGTVNSPALLMRSGLGDGEHLREQGIAVAGHLPGVGRNMQDHTCVGIDVTAPRAPSYGLSLRALPRNALGLLQYVFTRTGLFASNIVEAGGFVRTDPSLARPNLSFTFMSARRNPGGKMGHGHGYALVPQLLRPKSRGAIRLQGADPDRAPWIDPGCLKVDDDLEVLLQGLKLGRRLLGTPAFRRFGGTEDLPGAALADDDALRGFIRDNCKTAFHSVGTCAMGVHTGAVVDPELRVHGIAGLRVVDASVMPMLIGGNTNAPTIMIAEKAADMILGRAPPAPEPHR